MADLGLKELGYERTEKASPFHDDGQLWTDGVELVCDETAIVIDDSMRISGGDDDTGNRDYFRYPNSEIVRMPGGFFGSYDWGYDEDSFRY